MITPNAAREKIAKHYKRWYQKWAGALFCDECGFEPEQAESIQSSFNYSLSLQPPTEKIVLVDGSAVRAWVGSWKDDQLAPFVCWAERNWKSVGKQDVPEKLLLTGAFSIAKYASEEKAWKRLSERTVVLAERWRDCWQFCGSACAPTNSPSLRSAVERCAPKYMLLSNDDWEKLLATLDWLMDNPATTCYVRQLPIKGIDSKWLENHKSAVEPLYSAMTGSSGFAFFNIERQIRVRFLDSNLAPGGLRDISASPKELNVLAIRPRFAIVVENLTSLCCLPNLPGVVAFHGGGYAVDSLSSIEWMLAIPVLYWGDLDSNGFAILDRLRHHHPKVISLMMDAETLYLHRDLCGYEDSPNRGRLECLTSDEQKVLDILLSGEKALRLEQERIEWKYALACIKQAVEKVC